MCNVLNMTILPGILCTLMTNTMFNTIDIIMVPTLYLTVYYNIYYYFSSDQLIANHCTYNLL
jgi:hypothetical protein